MALLATAGLWLLYVAGANVLLHTHALRSWVSGPRLHLEYDSASSVWPMRIRVRNFRMSGEDPNVQWEFRFDEVRLSIFPLDLMRKRFHVRSAHGRGLGFRLRLKSTTTKAARAKESLTPPIFGVAAETVPKGRAPKSSGGGYWTAIVENLVADPVREIWVDVYRYRGAASLRGGFFLRPRSEVEIGPATLTVRDGTLALGPVIVASPPAGTVACSFRRFDPEKTFGDQVLKYLSARVHVDGRLESLAFLDHYVRGAGPRFEGGQGPVRADFTIRDGSGSGELAYETGAMSVRNPKQFLRGAASLSAKLRHLDFGRKTVDFTGSSFDARNVFAESSRQVSRAWWGRLLFTEGDHRGGTPVPLRATVTLRCRDARPLYDLLGVALPPWAEKILTLPELIARARVGLGPLLTRVDDLDARGEGARVRGRFHENGAERNGAFLLESGILSVGVDIDRRGSHVKLLGAKRWFEGRRS
jgi:hypothetical protein